MKADRMSEREPPCPFVYANGKQCTGYVYRWKTYGGDRFETARKVRLWCSEKDDHEGAVSSWAGKERMEFHPDKLPKAIREAVFPDS
jgi:hypothetical protein